MPGDARRAASAIGGVLPHRREMLDRDPARCYFRGMSDISRRLIVFALFAVSMAGAAFSASSPRSSTLFEAIDGGTLDLEDYRGGPVLVVNTASRCGSTPQFDALQALWERYRGAGLTVVGIPSKSFGQELGSAGEVKDFCEANFALDFPMTGLVEVRGAAAHPFYAWAAGEGYAPDWNFYKLLLDGDGRIVAAFDRFTEPDDPALVAAIEALLPDG
jgi:glutathione peroxidase